MRSVISRLTRCKIHISWDVHLFAKRPSGCVRFMGFCCRSALNQSRQIPCSRRLRSKGTKCGRAAESQIGLSSLMDQEHAQQQIKDDKRLEMLESKETKLANHQQFRVGSCFDFGFGYPPWPGPMVPFRRTSFCFCWAFALVKLALFIFHHPVVQFEQT